MLTLQGCSIGIVSLDIDENIKVGEYTIRPNKFQDETSAHPIYPDGQAWIRFTYTKDDLTNINEDDWGKVEIRFHIEPGDSISNNPADNVVSGNYEAWISGLPSNTILRPVGELGTYSTRLEVGQKEITVLYIASDVSGIYYVIGEAYYEGSFVTAKTSTVYVKIPELVEFPRYGIENGASWKFVGQTVFHSNNNYVQPTTKEHLTKLIPYIVGEYAKDNGGDSNFIVRMTDASLPWGGMFWIGYTEDTDLSINRVDGYGNPYTITYWANIHHRIYAPPHKTHRDGRNIDISKYSDDGSGSIYWSKCLSFAELNKAISRYNADFGNTFSVLDEGDHYHLTCEAASNYYYLGD
jgi:hypothetical protein